MTVDKMTADKLFDNLCDALLAIHDACIHTDDETCEDDLCPMRTWCGRIGEPLRDLPIEWNVPKMKSDKQQRDERFIK